MAHAAPEASRVPLTSGRPLRLTDWAGAGTAPAPAETWQKLPPQDAGGAADFAW
jgi:hypothetical protein